MPGRLRDPGPSINDARLDRALREDSSTETSARIANATARTSRGTSGRKDGHAGDYEEWTVVDLRRRAAEIGVSGRSRMRKVELIASLRRN